MFAFDPTGAPASTSFASKWCSSTVPEECECRSQFHRHTGKASLAEALFGRLAIIAAATGNPVVVEVTVCDIIILPDVAKPVVVEVPVYEIITLATAAVQTPHPIAPNVVD